jgi:3'-5' exoribonuclease
VEATALHYADLMSARINQVSQLVKSHQGQGDWTGFDRYLGTSLFIPEYGKK